MFKYFTVVVARIFLWVVMCYPFPAAALEGISILPNHFKAGVVLFLKVYKTIELNA